MKVPSAPKWRLLQWFFISIFEKGETTSEPSEVIWNIFIHFILKLFFLGRFKYSQVRCLELAPPWKGRSPGPHPWHPPLPGKLQLDSNRWMECQFTWNQVNYKWTGPMWVQVNRSSEKKTLQLWFKWEKNQVKWFSSERIVKLPVCQVKGVCQAKSRSSESWIKWRLGQVKGQSSANLVKWKGWSSDYLLLWKVHQVNTLSSERLVKWMFGQVRSICNTTTPGTWKHIYIYTHKNMNR